MIFGDQELAIALLAISIAALGFAGLLEHQRREEEAREIRELRRKIKEFRRQLEREECERRTS